MIIRSFQLLAMLMLVSSIAQGQVTIKRTDAVIEHRTFDPKSPPADMPKLSGREAAVTRTYFGADSRIGGEVMETSAIPDGGYRAAIKVDTVRMTVQMRVTIWLPTNGNEKIRKHEEAHRKISEIYYKDAEAIAKKLADALIGQTITGTGKDADAAANNALKDAANLLGMQYLAQTDTPCGKAQENFDQITQHGTNAVNEDKAIEQAVKRVAENQTDKDSAKSSD